MRTTINFRMSLKFGQIQPLTMELPALWHLRNQYLYAVVATLASSSLIGSCEFWQLIGACIKD